jgi:hypothetical protein
MPGYNWDWPSGVGRRQMADAHRAVADAADCNGDSERATELRRIARRAEWRDGWRRPQSYSDRPAPQHSPYSRYTKL